MDRPVALALSGGGDSMALLDIGADWAHDNGRALLVLTVDHGLNSESAGWTAFSREAAHAVGAEWRGLAWSGDKPMSGLPAAARRARHALIADAAREAGARVVLFAHTADDVAEGELMRAEGSSLGRVRDWSPSPAWPEGRGLMLLRPMLDVGRAELRRLLTGRGVGWIDDPANDDQRFARSRARAFLLPEGEGGGQRRMRDDRSRSDAVVPHPPARHTSGPVPPPLGEGSIALDRAIPASKLAVALVCAGGGDRTPRGDRLEAVLTRLRSGEDFPATLCGARLEATGDRVVITREPGEFARRRLAPLPLSPGVETVWDGRYLLAIDDPGWSVAPAAGRMASLNKPDRAWLNTLSAAARGSQPVLIRDEPGGAVLAVPAGKAQSLVEERLAFALDLMTHEREVGARIHGAIPPNLLFCEADITGRPAGAARRGIERA